MSFLYPQFLYALFALSIPIIIHLFNFRKTKTVYFSNTLFLKKVKEASSAKRKLKHYLILASRLLFIFFLVLAFAQPFLPSEEDKGVTGKTLIYLDNSLSMTNEISEGISAFDEALAYINALTAIYPASAEYKIITNDFDEFSGGYKNKNDLAELTTEMRMSGVTRSYEEIQKRLMLHQDNDEQYDVYWISDFQRATSGGEREIFFDSTNLVNLIPLYFTRINNVFVDSIYLDNPFLIGDEKLKLNVVLKNIGTEAVNNLIVKTFVDEVQAATASVSIAPNDIVTATFDLAFNIEGNNRCRISFEEFPVSFDNDFYFTINGSQKIDVLEIKSVREVTPIGSVFGNKDLFTLKSVLFSNLDYSLIGEADLVVVNGLRSIDQSLAAALNKYLTGYGDLVLIPAPNPDESSYGQLAGIGNLTAIEAPLKVDLATPDFEDPFFINVFEDTRENIQMPQAAGVLQWGRDRIALLKYRNGLPFLSKVTSNGSVYLLAAPLEDKFTNLHGHAIFVPVMYRIAVESANETAKLYYYVDDPVVTVKADTLLADNVFKLARDGKEIIPAQRVSGNNVLMEVPKFAINSGFYNLVFEDEVITTLAFNNSPEESDMRQYTQEELSQIFRGKIDVFDVENTDQFTNAVESKYVGQPLWKYAIVLALIFLLMEVLLIRFLP